jgi:chaperonin GroES
MALRPIYDIVVVEPVKEAEQIRCGIVVPTAAQDEVTEGTVVAVGPGSKDANGNHVTPQVAVGDVVIFTKNRGMEVEDEGKKLLIMNLSNVLAVRE